MALRFYLQVRTFVTDDNQPDPYCDVWLIKVDGPAHSQIAHGHAMRDTVEEMCRQFEAKGIEVNRENMPYAVDHDPAEVEPAVKQGTLFD